MRGEKVEGTPCVKCGNTVRYAITSGSRNKEGACINCKALSTGRLQATKTRHQQASIGIIQPYKKCYEQGFLANRESINPNPVSELGKRCAWFAGFNDSRATVNH